MRFRRGKEFILVNWVMCVELLRAI